MSINFGALLLPAVHCKKMSVFLAVESFKGSSEVGDGVGKEPGTTLNTIFKILEYDISCAWFIWVMFWCEKRND